MRLIPAVDDLILWHAAAILVLAWFIVAAASIEGDFAKPNDASWAKPIPCAMEYECDSSIRSSLQLDGRQGPHRIQEPFAPMTSGKTRKQ
jgi:hypothetical protein